MPEYNLCRICLTEDTESENMQPLFDEQSEECAELVRKIEECGGIKLRPLEDIPSMLCYRCLDSLNVSYKFRELCQASEHAFIDTVIKTEVKTEELNDDIDDSNGLIYDIRTEFIDAEEVEMADIVETSHEEVLEEEHIQYTEGNVDEDEFDEDGNIIEEDEEGLDDEAVESDCMYLANTSDSDYDPNDTKGAKTMKSKIRKTKLTRQRGRQRIITISPGKAMRGQTVDSKLGNSGGGGGGARGRKVIEDSPSSIMCEICGNIYTKRGALNMHMRRHLAEKPFACEICGKTFAGPSELNRHIRVHTGEKPFTCKFCNRSFADRSSNIRHERTHTNERPFSCTTCGKSFSYSNVLKNHMLTHTGEKPFLCVPCNKTFSRKHQLEQHIGTLTHQQTVKSRIAGIPNADLNIECVDE